MARVYNFSAGPAAMPESVLREAQGEMLDYRGTGMSVLEMSHRSKEYQAIIDDAEAALRELYSIPDDYRVLFLQGGATLQFAGVPMNLMRTGHAGYLVSGGWSKKAWQEAARYGQADVLASSEDTHFDHVPTLGAPVSQDLDYVYICQNETVFGTMYRALPQTGSVTLVSDVSSMFLSCPIDVTRYGLVYAGAQKNGGPAGVTVVIVRDDLIQDGPALADITPTYMGYKLQADKGSMYNTPNTYGIYLCGKIFRWVLDGGGVEAMGERNWSKVQPLYDAIDQSPFYAGYAQPQDRSIANVTFHTPTPELDAAFVAGAREHGIVNIKGHRSLGGLRASCYNAVSEEAVSALISYMGEFEAAHAAEARSL